MAYKHRNLFLTILVAEKSKLKSPVDMVSDHFINDRLVSSNGGNDMGVLWLSFITILLIPFIRASLP